MESRLIGIAGPLTGVQYELSADEILIGREPTNAIVIPDHAISRRHCSVSVKAGARVIADLGSTNGISVNGVPVRERSLVHGDHIEIGRSVFLFAEESQTTTDGNEPITVHDMDPGDGTAHIPLSEAMAARPEDAVSSLTRERYAEAELATLLKVSAVIGSIHSLEPLQRRVLEMALDLTGADWAAILSAENVDSVDSQVVCARAGRQAGATSVSRTAVARTLESRTALLWNSISGDDSHASIHRVVGSGAHSLAVVPIGYSNKIVGALYAATTGTAVLRERDLQLLSALAILVAAPLDHARRLAWIEAENDRLKRKAGLHEMVGESQTMRDVYKSIGKLAGTDVTVLIRGESGTGKELLANAIHRASSRASGPLVAINCAALSETLLESELFGHEKGAFTGAIAQKRGRIEEAHNGTLFLDEVGELALPMQAKLLRALQQREFTRVGGSRPIRVDFRLVAATNRDLEEAVKSKTFREDLYYRLNVVSVRMPSLRERRDDISMLATFFLTRSSAKCKRRVLGITPVARDLLDNYDWPGNVRELENAVERAVVMGSGEMIEPEDLPESLLDTEPDKEASANVGRYHEEIHDFKKRLIVSALEQANGSYTDAAKLLGLQVTYLHRLARNLQIRDPMRKSR